MERSSPARAVAQPAPPVVAADAAAAATPRPLPVHAGQNLQATVVAQQGDTVWLGYRGGVFAARAGFVLEPGRSYDFVVARTEPHIELAQARPAPGPVAALGPATPLASADLFALLSRLVALDAAAAPTSAPNQPASLSPASPAGPGPALQHGSGWQLPASMHSALQDWARGRPTAAALQVLDRLLGHDQEARVLRLLALQPEPQQAAAAELRATAKAVALLQMREGDQPGSHRDAGAAHLVAGLSGIERDNAVRSEQSAPLWLPLPASPEAGLSAARMFLLDGDGGSSDGAAAAGDAAFTVVLLLDLTRLGQLRVDVVLRGDRVDATFVAERSVSTALLLQHLDELRDSLAGAGLEVDALRVRQAPAQGLPLADLIMPPRDGTALVDLHA